jgi:hypothetical protein
VGRTRLSVLLALALLAGCQKRPRAPALVTEAVYENSGAGVKFLVPDGWTLYAKAEPPPGKKLDHPLRLVAYNQSGGGIRADLELYAIDLPDGQDVVQYLAAHPIGPDKWKMKGKPRPETINGAAATHYVFTAPRRKGEMVREMDAFQRPDRVYIFLLTYPSADNQFREQARRTIESMTWKPR